MANEFQFTHPGRGATSKAKERLVSLEFQFTHPGRGATHAVRHAGLDYIWFQFTHPGRGATPTTNVVYSDVEVSIHAPREGCDC